MSQTSSLLSQTRRQFLQTGSAVLAGTLLPQTYSFAQETSPVNAFAQTPIIDTHQHLWDLELLNLPWLGGAPESLKKSFVMSDYQAATSKVNIAKTIYMEVNVAEHEKEKEADYVIGLAKADDNPMVAAIIGGVPHKAEFADYAQKYAESEYVCGVRNVLHDPDRPQGMCLEQTFVKNMQLLGDLDLTFDLCMRPGEIGDVVKLAKQCPKNTVHHRSLRQYARPRLRAVTSEIVAGINESRRRLGQCGLQDFWHRGDCRKRKMDGQRSCSQHKLLHGHIRRRSNCVWWRLASLHAFSDLPAMGRCLIGNRERSSRFVPQKTAPRQCVADLRHQLTCRFVIEQQRFRTEFALDFFVEIPGSRTQFLFVMGAIGDERFQFDQGLREVE